MNGNYSVESKIHLPVSSNLAQSSGLMQASDKAMQVTPRFRSEKWLGGLGITFLGCTINEGDRYGEGVIGLISRASRQLLLLGSTLKMPIGFFAAHSLSHAFRFMHCGDNALQILPLWFSGRKTVGGSGEMFVRLKSRVSGGV